MKPSIENSENIPRKTLFRPQAVAQHLPTLQGNIILVHAPSSWVLLGGFTIVLGLALSWLIIGEYAHKANVSGMLAPSAGEVKIFAPANGTLLEQRVKEGQTVRAGEVLFVLSGERHTDVGQGTLALSIASLTERRTRLEQEIQQAEQVALSQLDALQHRLSELVSEQQSINTEISLGQQRVALAEKTLAKYQHLHQSGFVSVLQVQQKQEEILDLKGRLASAERNRRVIARERLSLANDVKTLPLRSATQVSQLRRDLAALQQAQTDAEGQRRFVVTAPTAGVVAAVNRTAGQYVDRALPLATILPAGSQLEALVYAPSQAIGFIQRGHPVWLRYPSFPYQKFGQQKGHIIEVANAAVDPQVVGLPAGEAVYRIRVKLDQQGIMAYGRWHPLKPSMRVDASVELERRRLLEWLFEPLISAGKRL